MNDITDLKTELRTALKQRRDAMGEDRRRECNQAIRERLLQMEEIQQARNIFCFISHGSEVDTQRLLDHWFIQKKRLAAPRIMDSRRMIAVPLTDWSALAPGQLGILTPRGTTEFEGDFDVCITPGLGFTVRGERLGYGRGYYDQWFGSHVVKFKIALAYECQLLDELPTHDQDVNVDKIITEKRIIDTA